jgi:alpha-methylacyl-CoA racemase
MPAGPLADLRVVELAGLGPVPFAGMMLSDLGADVILVDRPDGHAETPGSPAHRDPLLRNRRRIVIDLKKPAGTKLLQELTADVDIFMEGLRPGTVERLGIGPEVLIARNRRLVYARMTGWGQDGPLAQEPGHDINYIGLTGALAVTGTADGPPVAPPSLIGDFGGGGMLLIAGVLAALVHARASGEGQVVDAAMVDGSALLMTLLYGLSGNELWTHRRGGNFNDSALPSYRTYETADGKYVAVGALESRFHAQLRRFLNLPELTIDTMEDRDHWPAETDELAAAFKHRSRDEWCRSDGAAAACVTPVLDMLEAPSHPHNVHRGTFVDQIGLTHPAPAPRLSRTPAAVRRATVPPGADTRQILVSLGYGDKEIDGLQSLGVVGQS